MVTLKSLLKKPKSILKEDLKSDATKFAKTKYPAGDGYWDLHGYWQKEKKSALTECAQAFIEGAMWAKAEIEKKNKKKTKPEKLSSEDKYWLGMSGPG